MKKFLKFIGLLFSLLLVLVIYGCTNSSSSNSNKNAASSSAPQQTLSGVYKISDKDVDTDDDGNQQPGYYYFKKNGQLLWAQPETGDKHHGRYGDTARGTWKSLGNNKFELHMKYVYDNDDFTFTAKKSGDKLHTYSNSKDAKYSWEADDNYKQPDMTYSDFMDMFNKAKDSEQKKVQENGYDVPDNDSGDSNSSSSSESSTKLSDGDQAVAYFKQQKGLDNALLLDDKFDSSDPHAKITDGHGHVYNVYADGRIEETESH